MDKQGLLQKAFEQQETIAAEAIADPIKPEGDAPSIQKILVTLIIGALMPTLLLAWFGIYLVPDALPITTVVPIVSIISIIGVWFYLGVGLPISVGGAGVSPIPASIVVFSYLSMILLPFILGSLLVGDMSIGSADINEDGSELNVKIRQNGGSPSTVNASVTIGTWSETMQLSINRSDGAGDYGLLTLTISDFYSGNPELSPSKPEYVAPIMEIIVDGNTMSTKLDANVFFRTITDVQSSINAIMSEDSDDCGSHDNCVIGASLIVWIGLEANSRPGPMPLADYNLSANLFYEDGSIAIPYPEVTVVRGKATWDSESGEYGSGAASVGEDTDGDGISDIGSELPLQGSVQEPQFGEFKYIPKDGWGESDYGCYYFTIEVTQVEPYNLSSPTISETSYYNYVEETDEETGAPPSESWLPTDSC